MIEDITIENNSLNYDVNEDVYTETSADSNNETNSLYLPFFYYNGQNNLEVIIKELLGSKPAPLSNVEIGLYVLGTADTNQGLISYKDTIGGKDLDEILYHELLHILNPEQDEAWVREQTLKAGYSRFQYPIANYN